MDRPPTYQYLFRHGAWQQHALDGVVQRMDEALALQPLPRLVPLGGGTAPAVAGVVGPVGVAVDRDGAIVVGDLAAGRLVRIDPCDGTRSLVGCDASPGGDWTVRGMSFAPRGDVVVADAGAGRVLAVDPTSGATRATYGWSAASASDLVEPGALADPISVAVDADSWVYVADSGWMQPDGTRVGGRVQRFAAAGAVDPHFAAQLALAPLGARPRQPIALALAFPGDRARLLMLEGAPTRMLAFDLDGRADEPLSAVLTAALSAVVSPTAMAVHNDIVAVVAPSTGTLLTVGRDGRSRGTVALPTATAAGIAFDRCGRLVVHIGGGGAILVADVEPSYVTCGTWLAGPFVGPVAPTRWQRVEVGADPLPALAHVQFHTLTSDTLDGAAGGAPSHPATCAAGAPQPATPGAWDPAALDVWRAAPLDATDFLALNASGRFLWIAARLTSDGTATPVVRQVRLRFDDAGWLPHLPALYTRNAAAQRFLERFLALFQGLLGADAELLDRLPSLMDARAAPDDEPRPTWLEWLAGWVDARLEDAGTESDRRRIVASAFRDHARRGTRASMSELIARATGAVPLIVEPGIPGPWALGLTPLGFETALAVAVPQPAALQRTALVNASALIPDDEFGSPPYEWNAHRFVVQLATERLRPGMTHTQVEAVIDRERPAHTEFALCTVPGAARAGWTSRVGVDARVGGAPSVVRLGEGSTLGEATYLGTHRAAAPSRTGITRLT